MTERRFSEDEVADIFARATEATEPTSASQLQAAPGDGMTLAQLQDIGREVGIPAESIARAALAIDRVPPAPTRKVFGLPLGVERTIQLGRKINDEEWERIVVLLRETFNARGTMTGQGSLRQWTNGNLQALLEPTANGQRIRLRTTKGNAAGQIFGGLAMTGVSGTMLVASQIAGAAGDAGRLAATTVLGVMGVVMLATGALGLPRWARTRQQQMDAIAATLETEFAPRLPSGD